MTEAELHEWNDAVRNDLKEKIRALQDRHLARIHHQIMNDDPNYRKAGWK